MKKIFTTPVLLILLFWGVNSEAQPQNIIIYIGDGLGFEQVKAARLYLGEPLSFEEFPYQGQVQTLSADSVVTDSAAAATAMATGTKVNNGVISVAFPGDGGELITLLEDATAKGKMTGLVSTAYLTHATPAAFGAHETSRSNYAEIAGDYLNQTLPNVLFGGGGNGLTVEDAQSAGYEVAIETEDFNVLDTERKNLSALFGTYHMPYKYTYLESNYPFPTLAEMTSKALATLDSDPNGFFLLVEGGRIDHACHSNQLERAIHEVIDFAEAVRVAMDWAAGRSDTLIIVTADHETGGLSIESDNGAFEYPSVSWSTTGHTGVNVPIYVQGENAKFFNGIIDNTDVFRFTFEDDIPPSVSFAQAEQIGDVNSEALIITLQLSGLSSLDVSVPFTISGSAVGGGVDYTITQSPLIIPAGSMSGAIVISPVSDTLDESDETIVLTMENPANAVRGTPNVHTTTLNDGVICSKCSGANPVVQHIVFKEGTDCTCVGSESLVVGPDVVVEANARVVFSSERITVQSNVKLKEGAVVIMGR